MPRCPILRVRRRRRRSGAGCRAERGLRRRRSRLRPGFLWRGLCGDGGICSWKHVTTRMRMKNKMGWMDMTGTVSAGQLWNFSWTMWILDSSLGTGHWRSGCMRSFSLPDPSTRRRTCYIRHESSCQAPVLDPSRCVACLTSSPTRLTIAFSITASTDLHDILQHRPGPAFLGGSAIDRAAAPAHGMT